MANQGHLKKLREGVEAWNQWRMENRGLEPEIIFNDYGILKCFHAGSQVCPFGADILLLCNHGALLYCQYGLDQPIIPFLVAAPASPGGTSLNASPNPIPR